MSILIKGIEIPKPHHVNGFYIYDDGTVRNLGRNKVIGQAIEVPTPHGRLIDADAFENYLITVYAEGDQVAIDLQDRETVIEAEES